MEELKRFRCSRLWPDFGDSVIPELKEVLELVKPSGITVNIELKTGVFRYKGIEKEVLKQVKNAGMEERVIYSSFHHPSTSSVLIPPPVQKTDQKSEKKEASPSRMDRK